jgi:Lon protease-like protein
MRRHLPPKANLEHLKKQAKDLLDGHRRADPEALARIRDAVPAFAGMTDDAVAHSPFALHDAQSAVAREYATKSWSELREVVAAQNAAAPGPSDEALRALLPFPFPPEIGAVLRGASARRAETSSAAEAALPSTLPLVAMRNALFLPRALGPIRMSRATSRAAVEAALARTPPTLAVFAQRAEGQDVVDTAALHPVGCEAFVHARLADGEQVEWVVLEGVRWISLESVEMDPRGYQLARVAPWVVRASDGSEIAALADPFRRRARDLASHFPDAPRLLALIDAAEPMQLADMIVANLPVSVDDKARYASANELVERLRIAGELVARTPG